MDLPLIQSVYVYHDNYIFRESRNEPTTNCRRVGDLVLKHLNHGTLEHYYRYIDTHIVILDKIQQSLHKINRFEQIYTDFEMQKVILFLFQKRSYSFKKFMFVRRQLESSRDTESTSMRKVDHTLEFLKKKSKKYFLMEKEGVVIIFSSEGCGTLSKQLPK